jgi:hypothetical protein
MTSDFEYGLLYDKKMFAEVAKEIVAKYNVKSVCEYPSNELMGNNSDIFQDLGCYVKRYSTYPKTVTESFDLVWNFCETEKSSNPTKLIDEMLGLTNRYVLIVVQNKCNIGVQIHRIYHKLMGTPWDHGRLKYMSGYEVWRLLLDFPVKVVKVGAFDMPWFVLDFYESGAPLRRLVPKMFRPKDYNVIRESILERTLPQSLKYALAHHHYLLAEKLGV